MIKLCQKKPLKLANITILSFPDWIVATYWNTIEINKCLARVNWGIVHFIWKIYLWDEMKKHLNMDDEKRG